jgi:RHS repeat-associated protein
MVTPADEVFSYNYDAIGNTIAITDNSQQIVNAYAYTPFGIITDKQEAISQPFTFVGQHGVMTEPNGFYYMRARYYDPHTGRFISQDPLGFDGGDVNLYIYAANNPIVYLDPNGQWVTTAIGAASGGLSGLMTGIQNGNVWAGIAGGVAGALAGGAIGTFAGPLAARLAGAAVGSVIAGAIAGGSGGAVGGAVAAAISEDSVAQGITTGAITGAITGAVSGPMGYLAKLGVAEMAGKTIGRIAIALASENVGLPVGVGTGILLNPKP